MARNLVVGTRAKGRAIGGRERARWARGRRLVGWVRLGFHAREGPWGASEHKKGPDPLGTGGPC